jgi:hypothetical protein
MDGVRGSGTSSLGYELIALGVVAFVAACFLPYYSVQGGPGAQFSPSLYDVQTARQTGPGAFGGILILFSGPAALAVAAFFGIRRPRGWTAIASVAITAVWGLTWIGILLSGGSLFPPKEVGYWLLVIGVGVVTIGAVVVVLTSRRAGVPGDEEIAPTSSPG